jgi:hypothetical protein
MTFDEAGHREIGIAGGDAACGRGQNGTSSITGLNLERRKTIHR